MKFKSLRKLALSGVALAAAATTLGTSTFAWYVTNSTATASGVNAASTAGGLGNVLVAQLPTDTETSQGSVSNGHGAFQRNITMENGSFNKVLTTTSGLTPVSPQVATTSGDTTTYTAATTINSDTTWFSATGAADETDNFLQFDLWILSTSCTTITFQYTFTNTTTGTFPTQLAYASTGAPVAQGQTFSKNIEDALRMAYTQTDYTSSENAQGEVTYTAGTPKATVIMDVAGSAAKTATNAGDLDVVSGGNAHNYYQAVLGEAPVLATELTGSTTTQTITVVAGQETKLSFYIWLEGTDTDCFDSCSGQSFSLAFSFTGLTSNSNSNQPSGD